MKAVRSVIASNGVPYLQMRSLGSHSTSGRKEGNGLVGISLLPRQGFSPFVFAWWLILMNNGLSFNYKRPLFLLVFFKILI